MPGFQRVKQEGTVKEFQDWGCRCVWNAVGQDVDPSDPQIVPLFVVALDHGICWPEWHVGAFVAALE